MAKGIFWLASYPKSGNTWLRTFLSNLKEDNNEPVSINALSTQKIASSRDWMDDVLGFDTADLYASEIDRLRPRVYEWSVQQADEYSYHKIHDACWQLDSGEWLVSEQATVGALYVIRNPLDLAISFSHHMKCGIDEAIRRMNKSSHFVCNDKGEKLHRQIEQRLLTWSQHVSSWVDNPVIDVHVMRYEDMKHQPQQTFTQAATYLQLSSAPAKIAKAVRFSDFNVVQQEEVEKKFRERPINVERFFRKGITGDWQETLTTVQIDQIVNDHYEVMQRFGYLDKAGEPQIM